MSKDIIDVAAAMGEMDDALVSEAARAGSAPKRRTPWLLTAAAAAVLALGAAIVLPKVIGRHNEQREASLPTQAPVYEGNDAASTEEPAITVEPAITAEPVATQDAPVVPDEKIFDTVVALSTAVKTGTHSEGDALYDLSYIYMPTRVPYGAEFSGITVTPDYTSAEYRISHEYGPDIDEDDPEGYPDRFVFIWRRDWQPGSAEEYVKSLYANMNGYFLHENNGFWTFQSGLEIMAVWEENGSGYELIMPCGYDPKDMLDYRGMVKVDLNEVEDHDPYVGLEDDSYMQIKNHNLVYAPRTSFAFGTTYYKPEDGGEGIMLETRGLSFVDSIPEEQRGYDHIMPSFPHAAWKFKPVLRDDAEITVIDVYDPITLEPIELDVTMDELMDMARGDVDEELMSYITGDCRGCVLVCMTVVHRGDYVEELDTYETDAYYCGFILECGF